MEKESLELELELRKIDYAIHPELLEICAVCIKLLNSHLHNIHTTYLKAAF